MSLLYRASGALLYYVMETSADNDHKAIAQHKAIVSMNPQRKPGADSLFVRSTIELRHLDQILTDINKPTRHGHSPKTHTTANHTIKSLRDIAKHWNDQTNLKPAIPMLKFNLKILPSPLPCSI